jgi:phospholipase/carboxylesterase/glyoxalase family protein
MPRFFRRTAIGVFDTKDLIFQTHELAKFVEAASMTYSFDLGRIVAVGYSNGANIASSLLLLHPGLLAGAILFRPVIPFTPERLPDLSGVRVLILGGLADQMFPKDQTELLSGLLKEAHADTSVHWQNSDHSLAEDEVVFARRWLSRFLEFEK